MALAVGNLLDTGCEKHRIQCDFLHLFNPFKPDFHRIKKSQQVNESTGQRVIGYRGGIGDNGFFNGLNRFFRDNNSLAATQVGLVGPKKTRKPVDLLTC